MAYPPDKRRRIDAGLCVQCGKVSVPSNRRVCQGCSARMVERDQQRIKARASAGLCIYCGAVAEPESRRCHEHVEREQRYYEKTGKIRTAKWRAEHPGYHNEAMILYRKRHPKRITALNRKHAQIERDTGARRSRDEKNRSRIQETMRQYRMHNREAVLHKERVYRHRRRKTIGKHTLDQWLARVAYYGWRCRWCKKQLTPKTLTQDHMIPLAKGGTNWPSNLAPSCQSCNSGKRDKRHYIPPTSRNFSH